MPQAAIQEFQTTRERTLSLVAGLSDEEMARRPESGKWSAGELVDHLLRTETLWRGEVEELIRLVRSDRQPFLSRLLTDFPLPIVGRFPRPLLGILAVPLTMVNAFVPTRLFLSFLRYRTVPAVAPPLLAPRPGRAAEELRGELKSEAEATARLFETHGDLDFRTLIYQHPLLGIVNAVDLLQVTTAHEKRHQDQLVDILTAIGVRGRA